MFPGGDTHMRGIGRRAHESNWSPHAADLAKKTGAVVIPIRFGLRPAKHLPWLGRIRARFIPEEPSSGQAKLNKGKIQLAVGSPISNSVLKSFSERQYCADFLRLATRVCGEHFGLLPRRLEILKGVLNHKSVTVGRQLDAPLAPAVDPSVIDLELSALPAGALIHGEGDFFMYHVRASEIPNTLIELGRLRELTFRCIGEGTGKLLDLDEFDDFYTHLLVWDRKQRRLVGAYRMGSAIAHRQRYVETLFQISGSLLRRLHSALELGRSFITPDYQVHSGVLNLMWKGIAQLVSQDPSRPILFGPVSMSAHFHPVSQALILHYLRQNHFDVRNARQVRAPIPPKWPKKLMGVDIERMTKGIRSIDHLSAVVSVLEKDGKGIPPLIKHYVRLGGRFLAFGVDEHFGNAVDGLLLLDLRETPFVLLKRFMGEAAARTFIDYKG
jgi:putative hemolysin